MAQKTLTAHLQDCIVFLCITSSNFLRVARSAIRPEILPSAVIGRIVRVCFEYYDLTKEAPQDHICDILADVMQKANATDRELIGGYIERISQMHNVNDDYVLSQLSAFVKTKEFELAAIEFVKLVDRQEFDKAQFLMTKALKAGVHSINLGCDYFTDFTSFHKVSAARMTTYGIEELDKIRVLSRKELLCVLGGMKGKKSWTGHHIGLTALMRGLNVLHVSHENSQELCEERYDRMAGSLTNVDIGDQEFDYHYLDQKTGKMRIERMRRPCVSNDAARRQVRKRLERFGGRLIIKKFPMYTCTPRDLEAYIDHLEAYESFIPDVLINDYPDVMKPLDANQQTRDQLNDSYMYHKKLADERNMLVVVFSQATRAAIRAKRLTMQDFAEDIRKLANVDTAIGVCQTELQAENSLATVYVIAARSGRMDCGCGIVMNLDCGQYCTQSFPVKVGRDAIQVAEEDDDE